MSNEKPNAKELIEDIKGLQSVDEVKAFVPEGEERVTVLEAAEARIAELTEAQDSPDPEETEDPPETAEAPEETETDQEAEEEDSPDPEEIAVATAKFKRLGKAIEGVLEAERDVRPSNGKPGITEGKLEEAAKVLDDLKSVTFAEFEELDNAIKHHLQYDQQRRGLQQPSKPMKELITVYSKMGESDEQE